MTFFSNTLNVPVSGARLAPYYIYGLNCTLNGTTPNTKLDLGVGACSDSTDTIDMVLSAAVVIDTAVVGAGGIDTGTLGASSFYYVHVLGDSSGFNSPTAMISLSKTAPIMPYGYDSFRVVDIKKTDGSSHFLLSYTEGAYGDRKFVYDAPIAALTATANTGYTACALTTVVPPLAISTVSFTATIVAATAGDIACIRPTGGTGDGASISAQVVTVPMIADVECLSFTSGGVSSIDYKVASTGTLALKVKSFTYNV